jgi:DNA repair exonuclease SbcCD ATPase subunit
MGHSRSGLSESEKKELHKEDEYYEDEINLIDYFLVLGRHKLLIIVGSLLPSLAVGLFFYLSPRDYTISYTYDISMGAKDYKVLEETFYSDENINKLTDSLQESGLSAYAEKIDKYFVYFSISPDYFEAIDLSQAKNFEESQKLRSVQGSLLVMEIKSEFTEEIREIARVCRNNFERIIPMYSVREQIKSKISSLKSKMGDIESSRFNLNQRLDRKQATLEKLKKSSVDTDFELPNDLVLQFNNAAQNSQYLPISYQIQALKTQIINLEEQVRANNEDYEYYSKLFDLNSRIYDYLKQDGDIEQYHTFLTGILKDYEDVQELKDYLSAYIKQIENIMIDKTPVVELPKIYPLAKGTVKKAEITFAVALLLSIFAAFLREGLQQNEVRSKN